jgi:non-specific serine/threonine protein kinase
MSLGKISEYALSEEASQAETTIAQEGLAYAEPRDELTPREREVGVLVAQGLTNRQISRQLSISERTAANHVAKILKKLGLRSRSQIASRAAQR